MKSLRGYAWLWTPLALIGLSFGTLNAADAALVKAGGVDGGIHASGVPRGSVPVHQDAGNLSSPPATSSDRSAPAPAGNGAAPGQKDPVSVILARPLFDPSRHPDALASTPDTMPRLTGIVHQADLMVAIFQSPGMDHAQALRIGEMISGWSVVAITAESATLTRAGKSTTLRPNFRKPVVAP